MSQVSKGADHEVINESSREIIPLESLGVPPASPNPSVRTNNSDAVSAAPPSSSQISRTTSLVTLAPAIAFGVRPARSWNLLQVPKALALNGAFSSVSESALPQKQPTLFSLGMQREGSRRFSTITQINPETLRPEKVNGTCPEAGGGRGLDERLQRKVTGAFGNLALFKTDDETASAAHAATLFSAYTTPGPKERATSEHKKANLGVMLGVYLPTIQHILGVTMFIRLFWVVGVAGLAWTSLLLALCCACTLLTSISLSAVATNGVVESGGAYFMISRNLGAEFGSAVGILFYLANTVASSMYLVGGVEVMLMYLFPSMTIGGGHGGAEEGEEGVFSVMTNNYRIYGTAFLLLEVAIVAMGVKFVQLMAPVSLMCVILAVLAVFAGGVEKALSGGGERVCELNDSLIMTNPLRQQATRMGGFNPDNYTDICDICDKSYVTDLYCGSSHHADDRACTLLLAHEVECLRAFTGFSLETLASNLPPLYLNQGESKPGYTGVKGTEVVQDAETYFFMLLAIYFPAVTGIFTGTNMSGDLADPQGSIPSGTIAATITTSLIYYFLSIAFAACVDRRVLRDKFGKAISNQMVVAALAWPSPWIVTIGSFLSTFGAALQCLCSAPRLLQSIAKDDVIPFLAPFARVTKNNEPLLALLITAFIAELAVLLGEVDKIAEVLDFFFLMCYASVNLICFLHSVLKAPNWRPRFKYYHWSLSLIGAFLCFFIMFASEYRYAIVACTLTFAIYKYVEWKGAKKEWGDGIRGLALTTAQYSLLKVEDKDPHPKNWRPQLLILLSSAWSREMTDNRVMSLLNLAAQLKAGRGLAIAVALLKVGGPSRTVITKRRAQEIKADITKSMAKARLRGFGKTLLFTQTQVHGCISSLFQSVGIGGLHPNTVLLNWPNVDDYDELALFTEEMILGLTNENCVLLVKGITEFPEGTERLAGYLDIWWIVEDGGILMLIAYLLKQHKVWRGCRLRIFAISETSDEKRLAACHSNLKRYIYQLRIDAELFVVNLTDEDVDAAVIEKTAELEAKRAVAVEEMRGRSRESGSYTNEAYAADDNGSVNILGGRNSASEAAGLDRSASTVVRVEETGSNGETSFSQHPVCDLYMEDAQSRDGSDVTDAPFKLNLHKMNTSVRLNRVIGENSPDSQLILLTLPSPPRKRDAFMHAYLTYLDVLSEGLRRVLFVGGSGKEVMTIQS